MADLIKAEQNFSHPEIYQPRPASWSFEDLEEERIDLRHYWQVILKHKWLVLSVVLTVLAVAAVQTFSAVPLYRSTATVQIDPEPVSILPYQTEIVREVLLEPYLRTKYNVLGSRMMALRVVKSLRLEKDPTFMVPARGGILTEKLGLLKSRVVSLFWTESSNTAADKQEGKVPVDLVPLADRLRFNLDVSAIEGSRLVRVSYRSHDPQLTVKIINALAEEAIQQNFEIQFEATQKATAFLEKQMQEMKRTVERSEEEVIKYARLFNLVDIEEGKNLVLRKLEYLNDELSKTEAALFSKAPDYEVARKATVDNFPHGLKTPAIQSLEKNRFDLEQKLGSLLTTFGPDWPEVVQVKEQISQVETQLAKEKDQTIQHAKFEYESLVQRQRMISQALDQQQDVADRMSKDSIQYNILKREAETNKQLYDGLLQRVKEAGVAAGLKSSNIHLVDPATVPRLPYEPDARRNLMLGLLVGLMIGVGLAFFLEYIDNTVKTPDDVEQRLALASLGVIPQAQELAEAGRRRLLTEPSATSGGAVRPYVSPRSQIWEAYRSLRTSILLSHSGKPPQKILVTSALSSEGKSTTVANVGIVLAQTGARTLMLDLDMRRPMLADMFGVDGGGMSNFLSGNSDLSSQIRQTAVPNLFLLPAGTLPPNPAELIGSEKMEQALGLLADYFKYIVIDSPPILSVTDALVLSPHVDGVVLVVQGGKTPRDAVKKASGRLLSVGAKILGVMINKVDVHKSGYYYYYRNYYDYGYYKDYKDDLSATG